MTKFGWEADVEKPDRSVKDLTVHSLTDADILAWDRFLEANKAKEAAALFHTLLRFLERPGRRSVWLRAPPSSGRLDGKIAKTVPVSAFPEAHHDKLDRPFE